MLIRIAKALAALALMVLVIDAAGFTLWLVSGQTPTDSAYVGTITAHVVGYTL